jgi:hypothetical protein
MPPPLSSVLVRLLYVLSWPALAGSIFFGGYSWWYFDKYNSTYGLTDVEKAEVIRMKENCLWADIGWSSVVAVVFILLKALYFVLKGEPQSGDQGLYDKFNTNFAAAFGIIAFATFFAYVLSKG